MHIIHCFFSNFEFQNMLFYYDYESCNKPSGVILLEGSYCSKLDFSSGTSKVTGKIHPENEVTICDFFIFLLLSKDHGLLTICDL